MADILVPTNLGNAGQAYRRFKDMGDGTVAEVVSAAGAGGGGSVTASSNAASTAYEASRVIKATAGVLRHLTIYNSASIDQFYQLHDAAALPANGAAPVLPIKVPAGASMALDFGSVGRSFANGIVVCNSSTGPTKTIGAADSWFDAQYV